MNIAEELENLGPRVSYRMWAFTSSEGKALARLATSENMLEWTFTGDRKHFDISWEDFKKLEIETTASPSGTTLTFFSDADKYLMIEHRKRSDKNTYKLDESHSIKLDEGWKVKHKFVVMHIGWEMDNWGVVAEGPEGEVALYMGNHGGWVESPISELEELIDEYEKNLSDSKKALGMLKHESLL